MISWHVLVIGDVAVLVIQEGFIMQVQNSLTCVFVVF